MNEDQLNDLKQFIAATVSQATANMATKDDISSLENRLERLEKKVDDGFAGVADALDQTNERMDDFDQRLTRLEQQAA